MTRRDYILIATTLRSNRSATSTDGTFSQLCLAIAEAIHTSPGNENFNVKKFLAACGVQP